jgi:precorrin-6B methylase 2
MAKTAHEVQKWLGYLYPEEVDYLKALSKKAKAGAKVINIGAGGGTSGVAFMESNPDILVWTIDITKESSPFGCLEGEWAVLKEAGLVPSDRYVQVHARSQAVAEEWQGGKVDIVFVDGGHTYNDAKGDILGWLKHLRVGGLMIVHDVYKVDYFKALFPNDTHDESWVKSKVKPHLDVERAVSDHLDGKYKFIKVVGTMAVYQNSKPPRKKTAKKRKATSKTTRKPAP